MRIWKTITIPCDGNAIAPLLNQSEAEKWHFHGFSPMSNGQLHCLFYRDKASPRQPVSADFPERIITAWNSTMDKDTFKQISTITTERRRRCHVAWRHEGDIQKWKETFGEINQSPFCRGNNNNKWKAAFDWAIKPVNQEKVVSGMYGGKDKLVSEEMELT